MSLCMYPISSQYGLLPRVLYYCLIVFAALAYTHRWVIAGALATALTYSGAAGIHKILLSIWEHYGVAYHPDKYDTDDRVLFQITSVSILFAAPLANWSSTIRKFDVRRMLWLWTALMFCCYMLSFGSLTRSDVVMAPSQVRCSSETTECSAFSSSNNPLPSNISWLQCGCRFQCSNASIPHIPFRAEAPMVSVASTGYLSPVQDKGAKFILAYLIVILSLCALTQISINLLLRLRQPSHFVRAFYWRCINISRTRLSSRGHLRCKRLLRIVFIVSYPNYIILFYALPVLYPLAFIVAVVFGELALREWPDSERPSAVGQWTPWLSVALVLAAAFMGRSQRGARSYLVSFWRKISSKHVSKLHQNPPNKPGTTVWRFSMGSGLSSGFKSFVQYLRRPFQTILKDNKELRRWWKESGDSDDDTAISMAALRRDIEEVPLPLLRPEALTHAKFEEESVRKRSRTL